jgi:hypothetical protein
VIGLHREILCNGLCNGLQSKEESEARGPTHEPPARDFYFSFLLKNRRVQYYNSEQFLEPTCVRWKPSAGIPKAKI